jgi:Zn-dependent membrane protease YugP
MLFDPVYFLVVGPGLLLALWASFKVKSTFNHYSQVATSSGLSGAEVALELLRRNNIHNVRVEPHEGFLSDHYDPSAGVVRLSPAVYEGRSVAAFGVAAHECGHVLQQAQGYGPMIVRQSLVGPASFGSNLSYLLIIGGYMLQASGLILVGILAFSAVVLFQLVTLPVEFNASSRARAQLLQTGLVTSGEDAAVGKVLNAAALTYVAGLLTSVLTLVYYIWRFAGGSSDD